MITKVYLKVGLTVNEKVTGQQVIDFVREAVEKHRKSLAALSDHSKMAHLTSTTVSIIEKHEVYQHD